MRPEVYRFILKNDPPAYPCVFGITRGKGWLDIVNVPNRLLEFLDIDKENSECYRCRAFRTLEEYAAVFRKKEDYKPDVVVRGGRRVIKGRLTFEIRWTPPKVEYKDLPKLSCMSGHLDGAHCGLGDWYPEIDAGIREALRGNGDWTTGWYGSKKEIASACISRSRGVVQVEVSVSNDFDTEGHGEVVVGRTRDIEKIRKAIYEAWDLAEDDQKSNEPVEMWSIHAPVLKGFDGKKLKEPRDAWIETYLRDRSGYDLDKPPGDNYHRWGFQGEKRFSRALKEKLEDAILACDGDTEEIKVGRYTCKRCT